MTKRKNYNNKLTLLQRVGLWFSLVNWKPVLLIFTLTLVAVLVFATCTAPDASTTHPTFG